MLANCTFSGIFSLALRKFYFDFVTGAVRLHNAVDNGLIVEDLARRNGRFAAVLNGFDERADFFIENVVAVMCFDDRDLGFDLFAGNRMINGHRAADRAVPAVGRRNAKTALCTEHNGITGSVDIHGPCDTEVNDSAVFETDKAAAEIVHAELGGKEFRIGAIGIGFGIGTEIVGNKAGNRDRLRIADGV